MTLSRVTLIRVQWTYFLQMATENVELQHLPYPEMNLMCTIMAWCKKRKVAHAHWLPTLRVINALALRKRMERVWCNNVQLMCYLRFANTVYKGVDYSSKSTWSWSWRETSACVRQPSHNLFACKPDFSLVLDDEADFVQFSGLFCFTPGCIYCVGSVCLVFSSMSLSACVLVHKLPEKWLSCLRCNSVVVWKWQVTQVGWLRGPYCIIAMQS